MKYLKKNKGLALSFLAILASTGLYAQGNGNDRLDQVFRSSGKIYVVFGVVAIIFLGILIYLIVLERKVSRLEEQIKDNN